MNRKNRIRGMVLAVVLLVMSLVLVLLPDEIGLFAGSVVGMFCGGYALRDILEPVRDE